MPSYFILLIACALIAFAGAAAGIWLTGLPDISRKAIPLSGAILLAISLFLILPELAQGFGWSTASALMLAGVAIVAVIDRYVYPICPACSHTHNHDACGMRLHGFATPLIAAALLHSLFDGWTFSAAAGTGAVGISFAVAVHKLPEGLALGVILRAAVRRRSQAILWAAVTQFAMIAGGLLEAYAAPYLGNGWIAALLALGGGMFLYLGGHAMHGEWKRRTAQREAELS